MFPRKHRLRHERDFFNVYRYGRTIATSTFLIQTLPNTEGMNRFGVVIANKVLKKATKRNRKKRQTRGALEELAPRLLSGYDIVVVAKPGVVDATFDQIKADIIVGFTKLQLFQ